MSERVLQSGCPTELATYLQSLLETFEQDPSTARTQLRLLEAAEPGLFCKVIVPLLAGLREDSAARQFVSSLLVRSQTLPRILSDPAAMSLPAARELASSLSRTEPALDVELARWLLRGMQAPSDPEAANPTRALRLLEVLNGLTRQHAASTLIQLLRHPNNRVRSKAALLVSRCLRSARWVETALSEKDRRVRANAIEGVWGVEGPGMGKVMRLALGDPDNRVAGNALVGLSQLGDLSASAFLEEMAAHKRFEFRATAAWAMGYLADAQFVPVLSKLLKDPAAPVRRSALRALLRFRKLMAQQAGLMGAEMQPEQKLDQGAAG